jgi:hypothetical protein
VTFGLWKIGPSYGSIPQPVGRSVWWAGSHGLKGSAVIGGRIFLPGGGITLGGNSGTNAMQVYRPTMRCQRGTAEDL